MKRLACVVGLLLLSTACGDDDATTRDSAALVTLTIDPEAAAAPRDSAVQLTAIGSYDDGSVRDLTQSVTWASSLAAVASVSADGLATTVAPGLASITATFGRTVASAKITVTSVTLTSIAVTPPRASVGVGATIPFVATGTYSDTTTAVLTDAVKWSSSDTDRATVSNASGSKGAVTGVASGAVQITAALNGISGVGDVSVDIPPSVGSTHPADAAVGVDVLSAIAVTFNRAMLPATITVQSVAGPCSGSLQVSDDAFATCLALAAPTFSSGNMTATAAVVTAMAYGTRYKARVTIAARSNENAALAGEFTQTTGFTTMAAPDCAGGLVVSQIYPFGGDTAAAYDLDYIEIFNASGAPIDLTGYALQFAPALGATWDVKDLGSVVLAAGRRFLFSGAGGPVTSPAPAALPQADRAAFNGSFSMSGPGGKVALTSTSTPLSDATPASAAIVDAVGWGNASFYEGAAATVTADTTKAYVRANQGCNDGGRNSTDFTAASAVAHTTRGASVTCACTNNERNIAAELDYCVLQTPIVVSVGAGARVDILTRVQEEDRTGTGAETHTVIGQIGYGLVTANPESQPGWVWSAMDFTSAGQLDDAYMGALTAPGVAGTYAIGARFSVDGLTWTYCDTDGAGANPSYDFNPAKLGRLTVTSPE